MFDMKFIDFYDERRAGTDISEDPIKKPSIIKIHVLPSTAAKNRSTYFC